MDSPVQSVLNWISSDANTGCEVNLNQICVPNLQLSMP
jgi:hypothetical protein